MKLKGISMPEPNRAMMENFKKRTEYHIGLVRKYLKIIHEAAINGKLPKELVLAELLQRGADHDASKYGDVERIPYVWLTEMYRCKKENIPFEYPAGVQEKVKEATLHHITSNRHHPEFHDSPSDMNDADIAEMVADWSAMAEELNEGSARGWADKNVGTKWEFSEHQVNLIYQLIGAIENYLSD